MRIRFIAQEVAAGLSRNVTMTLAVILTVAVSLTLFGTGLLVRSQVNTMKDFWYDKVEVSVFLCGENSDTQVCAAPITDEERSALQTQLETSPLVQQVYFESSDEAFARFQEQFAESPILENVTPAALPESFRVKLVDPEDYALLATSLQGAQGIEVVRDQKRLLDNFFTLLNGLQALALTNTMRVSAFSRRRETGIMKLVGASNYYIRLPFLLEAAIAAAIGGIIACTALVGIKFFLIDRVLAPRFQFTAFIGWDDVNRVLPIVSATGISLAALAAFFAIRRYLRV